jgi:general secretion pathway protein D
MQRLHWKSAILALALTIGAAAAAQDRPAPTRTLPPAATEVPPEGQPRLFPAPSRGEDIEEVLKRVSASTGQEFLVDPRVRAFVFGVPDIETPTYAELLAILRMHGFAAFEVAGRVNIIPDANARFMPSRLLQRDDPSVADDEYVTRILDVENPGQLVPILRPLMPQSAHLAALGAPDGGTGEGKLILFDTYANVRRMTEIIDALAR